MNKNITVLEESEDFLEVGKEMDPISRNQSKRYLNPKHTPGRLYRSASFFPTETWSNSYSVNTKSGNRIWGIQIEHES